MTSHFPLTRFLSHISLGVFLLVLSGLIGRSETRHAELKHEHTVEYGSRFMQAVVNATRKEGSMWLIEKMCADFKDQNELASSARKVKNLIDNIETMYTNETMEMPSTMPISLHNESTSRFVDALVQTVFQLTLIGKDSVYNRMQKFIKDHAPESSGTEPTTSGDPYSDAKKIMTSFLIYSKTLKLSDRTGPGYEVYKRIRKACENHATTEMHDSFRDAIKIVYKMKKYSTLKESIDKPKTSEQKDDAPEKERRDGGVVEERKEEKEETKEKEEENEKEEKKEEKDNTEVKEETTVTKKAAESVGDAESADSADRQKGRIYKSRKDKGEERRVIDTLGDTEKTEGKEYNTLGETKQTENKGESEPKLVDDTARVTKEEREEKKEEDTEKRSEVGEEDKKPDATDKEEQEDNDTVDLDNSNGTPDNLKDNSDEIETKRKGELVPNRSREFDRRPLRNIREDHHFHWSMWLLGPFAVITVSLALYTFCRYSRVF